MAVSGSNLTHGNSGSNGPWTTASITPAANNLILVAVVIKNGASTNPGDPSLSGNGLTWVLVASQIYDSTSGSRRKLFVFRGMGASPSSGAITITGAEVEVGALWVVDQFSGVDISGTNGSGAIVQTAVNSDESGAVSTLTATLAAFASATNATYGADGNASGNLTITAGSGFAILGTDKEIASAGIDIATEFVNSNDTTVNFSLSANDFIGLVAIEIKAAPTIALTGTVTASITEADIVAGGKTIILTITNDKWIAAGAGSFDLQRQNIINGIDSAQSETLGWNLVPEALQGVAGVVRTSDTVVTITLDAFATYNITAQETITATIPSTALVEAIAIVASPTFTISATGLVKQLAAMGVG